MKVVLLCGGKGTRLAELTEQIPKGLVPIGERPIVWHVMRYFASFGHTEFVLLLGYMAPKFVAYFEAHNDLGWTIEYSDSGEQASKAERILAARSLLSTTDPFFLHYCDDLCDVDLDAVVALNAATGAAATLTAVRPRNPYGTVRLDDAGLVERFEEKAPMREWVNGGYMVIRPELVPALHHGELESDVLPTLAAEGRVSAHRHDGFWMSMNTYKESQDLRALWDEGAAPWKRWSDDER